jgi:hypothetical protein
MTTLDPTAEGCTPENCPSEGQMFYVPSGQELGTVALNRFWNNVNDHLDSTRSSVAGYALEGPTGFPFSSNSLLGLAPLYEGVNSAGDHALMRGSEELAGYTRQPLRAYGYPRFGNQSESILSLDAGGVRIESNRVYGGALWRWTWNGRQFLGNSDSLRGAYSILFTDGFTNQINENGDDCQNHSPLVLATNGGETQITTAVPLANPFLYGSDNACQHPVVWKDALVGKAITLNFREMGPVARYTSFVWLPNSIAAADFYHPITSVNSEFDRYWIYDAETADLQEVFVGPIGDTCEAGYGFAPNFGGIILSDDAGDYALGVYAVNVAQGGSVTGLGLLRHTCSDGTYSRMDVIRSGSVPAGLSLYNVYFMSGTVQQVRQHMSTLYTLSVR